MGDVPVATSCPHTCHCGNHSTPSTINPPVRLISGARLLGDVPEWDGARYLDMEHSRVTGLEMQGHYIEIFGPSSEAEILGVLCSVIGPVNLEYEADCFPLLTWNDGQTLIFVDVDPGPECDAILAIGDLSHDDQACESAAREIQLKLALTTLWRLRSTSDLAQGALVMKRAC